MFNGKRAIKTIMASKGLKTGEVASELGMETQSFSNWLYRENALTVKKLSEVAEAIGCHVALIDDETGKIYE